MAIRIIEYFRKRHNDRFMRKLRKNPVCKFHKGCTCNTDFLAQIDALDKFLESKPITPKPESGSSLGKNKISLLTKLTDYNNDYNN